MIFDEVARAAQYRKNSQFYQTVLEETLDSHMKNKKKKILNLYLISSMIQLTQNGSKIEI